MSMSALAIAAAGALVLVVALVDLFLTVFNYDGFTFVAARYQRLLWRALELATRPLPDQARHAVLSIGSAAMLPATVALWLAAEITGFAMVYDAGLAHHSFHLTQPLAAGIGSAFYLSAGAISSLAFGDIIARNGLFQALVDVETIIGLATFTLALGYVVTTFGVLGDLDSLHDTVRRHAEDPGRPSSILARHFRGGEPTELPDLLQSLSESLESYDEGLRRYPVVYYFHTRRPSRSVPRVFWMLGELLAQLRWGLPPESAMTEDPWLASLLSQYSATIARLQRSFAGPCPRDRPEPVDPEAFAAAYRQGEGDRHGVAFRALQERARAAAGLAPPPDEDLELAYRRYQSWLDFGHHREVVLARIARRLGYRLPEAAGGSYPGTSTTPSRPSARLKGS